MQYILKHTYSTLTAAVIHASLVTQAVMALMYQTDRPHEVTSLQVDEKQDFNLHSARMSFNKF